MIEQIKWVSGNLRPLIYFTLVDKNTGDPYDPTTWEPLILTGATLTMPFRKSGTTDIIDTLTGVFETDGTDGKIIFTMTATAASSVAGNYEGEIDIDYGGPILTVYEIVDFLFRDSF